MQGCRDAGMQGCQVSSTGSKLNAKNSSFDQIKN